MRATPHTRLCTAILLRALKDTMSDDPATALDAVLWFLNPGVRELKAYARVRDLDFVAWIADPEARDMSKEYCVLDIFEGLSEDEVRIIADAMIEEGWVQRRYQLKRREALRQEYLAKRREDDRLAKARKSAEHAS